MQKESKAAKKAAREIPREASASTPAASAENRSTTSATNPPQSPASVREATDRSVGLRRTLQGVAGAVEEKAATPTGAAISADTTDPFKMRRVSGNIVLTTSESVEVRKAREAEEIFKFLEGNFKIPLPSWTRQHSLQEILERDANVGKRQDMQEKERELKAFLTEHGGDLPAWSNWTCIVNYKGWEPEWFYHPDSSITPQHADVWEYQIFLRLIALKDEAQMASEDID